jgi:hypothetical protein
MTKSGYGVKTNKNTNLLQSLSLIKEPDMDTISIAVNVGVRLEEIVILKSPVDVTTVMVQTEY